MEEQSLIFACSICGELVTEVVNYSAFGASETIFRCNNKQCGEYRKLVSAKLKIEK